MTKKTEQKKHTRLPKHRPKFKERHKDRVEHKWKRGNYQINLMMIKDWFNIYETIIYWMIYEYCYTLKWEEWLKDEDIWFNISYNDFSKILKINKPLIIKYIKWLINKWLISVRKKHTMNNYRITDYRKYYVNPMY